jgi:hypothetical protein
MTGEIGCKRTGAALVLAAALTVVVGCQQELRTTALTPSRTPFVRDVPVPMSFELVDSLSRSYRTDEFRMVRHSYFGRSAPATAYSFYRNQMPRHGWKLLSDQHVQGTYNLAFRKGEEVATVVVERDRRDLLTRGSLVTVTVKPARAAVPQAVPST